MCCGTVWASLLASAAAQMIQRACMCFCLFCSIWMGNSRKPLGGTSLSSMYFVWFVIITDEPVSVYMQHK